MLNRINTAIRNERGFSIVEVMTVIAIMGIISLVTIGLITAVFNSNILAGQQFNQQATEQTATSFFNKRLGDTSTGKIGMPSSSGTTISNVSVAGDQFTAVSGDYCYRVFYKHSAYALMVAAQEANDNKCQTGENGVAPVRGPNQSADGAPEDPVLDALADDGSIDGELPSGTTVFSLANNVTPLGPAGIACATGTGECPFSYSQTGGDSDLDVYRLANSNSSGKEWYSDVQNLNQVKTVQVNLRIKGNATGSAPVVSDEMFQSTFYVGGGNNGGSSEQTSNGGANGLAARVSTDSDLPGNTFNNNVLTANSGGVIPAIDGVALQPGYRVLVKDEANAAKNGLYEVTQTGSDVIPGDPAVSGDVADYNPSLYWSQMGTNFNDASGNGNSGSWGSVGSGGTCPVGTTSSSDQQVTGSSVPISGSVWGTDIYTNDSNKGRVAVHTGVLEPGETGMVKVCQLPGQTSYTGSTRNGVTTSSYGSWAGSIAIVEAGSVSTPQGSSTSGFEGDHNATEINNSPFITTNYNSLWNANGGAATIMLGFRLSESGRAQTLFSTDGVLSSTFSGVDLNVTTNGNIAYSFIGNIISHTWSIDLNGNNLNNFVNQWVGAALAFSNGGNTMTLYLKDLSDIDNPWVSQGSYTESSYDQGQYLDCSATSCSTYPGSLVVGGKYNGANDTVTQKFSGRLSQLVTFERTVNPNDPNLYSNGEEGTPDTPGQPWILSRVADMDSVEELLPGQLITVSEGDSNGDSIWQLVTDGDSSNNIDLNNEPLAFERKDGIGQASADSLVPAGSVIATASGSAPEGYLMARGQAVSRSEYSELFAAIGEVYGDGNGSTTFNLPDLRGRVPVGENPAGAGANPQGIQNYRYRGQSSGSETRSLSVAQLPAHSHSFSGQTNNDGDHNHHFSVHDADDGWWQGTQVSNDTHRWTQGFNKHGEYNEGNDISGYTDVDGTHRHNFSGTTNNTGSGNAFNITQPYQIVNYVIKY